MLADPKGASNKLAFNMADAGGRSRREGASRSSAARARIEAAKRKHREGDSVKEEEAVYELMDEDNYAQLVAKRRAQGGFDFDGVSAPNGWCDMLCDLRICTCVDAALAAGAAQGCAGSRSTHRSGRSRCNARAKGYQIAAKLQ